MNIEDQKSLALEYCMDLATDFTEEEVNKFFPPSVQKAWKVGDETLAFQLKQDRKRRKGMTL